MTPNRLAAFVVGPQTAEGRWAAVLHDGQSHTGPVADIVARAGEIEATGPVRWVWWSASSAARHLLDADVALSRSWDIAEAHRLLHGRWAASPPICWAGAHGLAAGDIPTAPTGDLFDLTHNHTYPLDDGLLTTTGHLRGDYETWLENPAHLQAWAHAALETATRQLSAADHTSPRLATTTHAESATAVLCLELERDGLPLDRTRIESLIAEAAGPRASTPQDDEHTRHQRDQRVLQHVPGRATTDLRNPTQVRDLLAAVGVTVPTTRKWVLEPYRTTHPVVDAILRWRRDERIATTYGYRWLDNHVGADDRLRGHWTACDGAAGRMTADNGLHNLPTVLRPAVAAHPEHRFVRADLGQIEPRVLAVVAADPALAAATADNDLYAPVATQLGVPRETAKVAVLAAMYGQRSGTAGAALQGLQRAYPRAMRLLDDAYETGRRGEPLRTWGGRLVPTGALLDDQPPGADPDLDAARGRFARNAVIQGSAAELFKAWVCTVRATTRDLGAQVVLCLHDEILVHVPEPAAAETARRVDATLDEAARRWSSGAPVRFVADTTIIRCWSDAKP
ncbi:MAG: DNA polymerase [Dermatophilaceae bacterium]